MSDNRRTYHWPLLVMAALIAICGTGNWLSHRAREQSRPSDFGDQAIRLVAPGTSQFVLPRAGDYCIYHENHNEINGAISQEGTILYGLPCELTAPDGSAVPVRSAFYETYKYAGRGGYALQSFDAPAAGAYTLRTTTECNAVLVVAPGPGWSFIWDVGGGVLGLANLVVLIILAAKERMAKRQARLSPPDAPPALPS